MRLLSWNVAGIRARLKQGWLNFLEKGEYDVLCFQETKATQAEVLRDVKGDVYQRLASVYPHQFWHNTGGVSQRKGLSGTAIWSKTPPVRELPPPDFDTEGRITCVQFEKFILLTVYTPNSNSKGHVRAAYRADEWDTQFREYVLALKSMGGPPLVLCGDFNVARRDIDVYHPAKWEGQAGLLPEERANFEGLLADGFVDVFRVFDPNPKRYTYWNQKIPVFRPRNIGWRIDYFLVEQALIPHCTDPRILADVKGSDHCPITLDLFQRAKPHRPLIATPAAPLPEAIKALNDEDLQLALQAVGAPPAHIDQYSRSALKHELAERVAALPPVHA
jgi:exodeoxyribonuclease-3